MELKAQYSPAEWADLSAAPFAAAMYVATATGGRLEYTREMVVFTEALGPSLSGACSLARAVVGDLRGRAGNRLGTGAQALAYADRAGMLAVVTRAGAALEGKDEAASFAAWVLALARRVAAASSTGGLLGLGGATVTAAEELALRELKTALGAGSP